MLQLFRISPLGVMGAMATGMANGVLFGMGAVYAERIGLSVAQISIFMGTAYAGGMILQWPIGRLSDKFDRRHMILAVTFLAAGAAFAAAAVSASALPLLLLLTAVFGGTTLPMYSLCLAHTNDHLEPSQMVAASATLVLVGGLGASLGPLGASLVMSIAGPAGFFLTLGIVHAAIGVFALYRMGQRPPVPLEEQGSALPIVSSAVSVGGALSAKAVRDHMDRDLAEMSRSQMGRF